MKKVLFVVGMSVCAGLSQFLWTANASAANMHFSQSIVPVRFVYLNASGRINSVWSNVTEKDDLYVVKFFNEKKQEISANKNLLATYVQKNQATSIGAHMTQSTELVERGNSLEEIKTVV